ncbi:MAG: glycosyltransferase family 2 protein [Candidatus Nanopelagicales bacterium]
MSETSLETWWQDEEVDATPPIQVLHYVTAVVVSKNGAEWLPRTLQSMKRQSRNIDQFIAADVASVDESVALFEKASPSFIAHLPEGATQSDALNAALSQVETAEKFVHWVWILHDDSAPSARALEELLKAANEFPKAAVIGCKVIDWDDENHVLDVGSSITAIGTRYSELEHGELDQGQHDTTRTIHSVSHAGMLVRLEVWQQLGGFSSELPHFRNDTEFCWRVWESGSEVVVAPRAEIAHLAATVRDVRKNAAKGSVHFLDRKAGLALLFSRTNLRWLWLRVLLVILAGATRSLGYVVIQDVRAARDEVRATLSGILNRSRIRSLRNSSGTVSLPHGIRPSVSEQFTHSVSEAFNGVIMWWNKLLEVLFPKRLHISDVGFLQAIGAILLRPGSVLALISISIGLFITRAAFVGEQLVSSYTDVVYDNRDALLAEYLSNWHAIGFGSEIPSNPLLIVLWFLSSITFMQPDTFVLTLCVLGPWLSGLSLHLALRNVISNSQTRVWLAALYGLSPMVISAAANGNIAVLLFAILFPAFTRALIKAPHSWRFVAVASLLFAVLISLLPILWLLVLLVIVALSPQAFRIHSPKWLSVFTLPLLLTLPWSLWTLLRPDRWFWEFGSDSLEVASAWSALIYTGSGVFVSLLFVVLIVLSLLSLLDSRNNIQSIRGWKVISLTLGVSLIGQAVATLTVDPTYFSSLEIPALLIFAALLYCIASTAMSLRVQLSRSNFGWKQVGVAVSALALALIPLSSVVTNGLIDDLSYGLRRQPTISKDTLQGFAPDERLRTLYLNTQPNGELQAQILDGRPLSIGDKAMVSREEVPQLQSKVAQWLSGYAATETNPLVELGIGYIALPARDSAISSVSSKGNLERLLTSRNQGLLNVWRVSDVESRASIIESDGSVTLLKSVSKAPEPPEVHGVILPSDGARKLVLSDRRTENWYATLNGEVLKQNETEDLSWTIGPNKSGEILILYSDGTRTAWLLLSGITLVVLLLMIAPRRKNSYRDEWLEE